MKNLYRLFPLVTVAIMLPQLTSCAIVTTPLKVAGKVATTTVGVAGKAAGAGINAMGSDEEEYE